MSTCQPVSSITIVRFAATRVPNVSLNGPASANTGWAVPLNASQIACLTRSALTQPVWGHGYPFDTVSVLTFG